MILSCQEFWCQTSNWRNPKVRRKRGMYPPPFPPPPQLDSPFGSATIIPKASFHFYPGKFYYLNYGCRQLESLLCYFANEKVNFSLAEQERKNELFRSTSYVRQSRITYQHQHQSISLPGSRWEPGEKTYLLQFVTIKCY